VNLPKTQTRARLPARRPNALKHGAFSAIELLPWEDPDAFERLRQELWDEHKPEGPSQEDAVETILWCRWRKLRLRARRKFETAAAVSNVENRVFEEEPPPLFDTRLEGDIHFLSTPGDRRRTESAKARSAEVASARDDYADLLSISSSFYGDQNSKTVGWTIMLSPEHISKHLTQHVPEANFETTEQWIIALKREIDSVLLPKAKAQRPDPNGYWAAAAKFAASDLMMEDLEVEERLDANMDRALRRLFWLKAQKQLERDAAQKVINGKVK
jgi:hypothetical protein